MTNEVKQESDLIWSEIRGMSIDVYALPNQKIEDHVSVLNVPGNQLLVNLKSTAVLPALETALVRRGFEVEQGTKYVIIRRVEPVVDYSSLIVAEESSAKKPAKPNKR